MMQPTGVVPPPMQPMSMDQQQQPQPPLPPTQQLMMVPPQQQQPHQPPPAGWVPAPVPPPQPMQAQPQVQQYGVAQQAATGLDENRSLWIGDLQYWMDEDYLLGCFQPGEARWANVIRNKRTGQSQGYGFIGFVSRAVAERILQTYNGAVMPYSGQQNFRLKWATQGTRDEHDPKHTTIFVSGLDPNVTDDVLIEIFGHYGKLKHFERPVGKHCGFVQFHDRTCAEHAFAGLNECELSGGQILQLSRGCSPSNKQTQADQTQWNGYAQGDEAYGCAQGYEEWICTRIRGI